MGEPLHGEHRGSTDGSDRATRCWVVGGRRDCDHVPSDADSLGLGGRFAYEACRRCGGVVLTRLGSDSGGKG